jgi:hypothetical protein
MGRANTMSVSVSSGPDVALQLIRGGSLSISKVSAVRPYLFAGGIVALLIAGKIVFPGLGAGMFNITPWEIVLLGVVGAVLIMLGWQRRRDPDTISKTGSMKISIPTARPERMGLTRHATRIRVVCRIAVRKFQVPAAFPLR